MGQRKTRLKRQENLPDLFGVMYNDLITYLNGVNDMPVYRAGDIVLRDYQIEAFIGEGGFGEVYRARGIRLTSQLFALKILQRADLSQAGYEAALNRFTQEASLGFKINHPGIVRVFGFSQDEVSEQLVLVMAYAAGGSLRQAINARREQNQPYSVSEALRIGRGIAAGLAVLHAENVIHRDLSPNNILFDSAGAPLIADLGLAQTAAAHSLGRGDSGQPPPHPGTPGYRSPEHADGYNLLRPSADVYALGLLLFEMLTLKQYSSCRPGIRLGELRGDVPAPLDALLASMLAEDPRQRPGDGSAAEEVLRQAEEVLHQAAAVDPGSAPARSIPAPTAPVWTLDEGLSALEGMEKAQEWRLAEDLLQQLEATHPGNPKLILPRKQITQAAAARREAEAQAAQRAAEEQASREAAGRARQAELTQKRRAAEAQVLEASRGGSRRKLPGWLTALIALGGVGLLALCVVWALDGLQASRPPTVPVADPTHTPQSLAAGQQPTIKPTNQPTLKPTATANPIPAEWCGSIGQTWTSPVDGMTLLCVPQGEFLMGAQESADVISHYTDPSYDNRPQHSVHLDTYWIDQTEVTNSQYARCVAAGACPEPQSRESATRSSYYGNSQYAGYPVSSVRWEDAAAYCAWAGRQLPSEAEWEKAARGTDGQHHPWGNQEPNSNLLNWDGTNWDGSHLEDTAPVGSYPAGISPYGALDMAGNVAEWTADWYDGDYYASQTTWYNPTGPASGQQYVYRGGYFNQGYYWENYLAAHRESANTWEYGSNLGFRCILRQPYDG